MKFVFFDYEVFSNDWMVVLIEENKGQLYKVVIKNNPLDMMRYYDIHKNDIWIGYNCNHYDQWILKAIMCGIEPVKMNDWIIHQERQGWEYSSELREYKLNCYDVYNRVTDGGGLKALESSLGLDIKETSIPFDINRKLTKEELEEVEKYCTWDVLSTRKVFYERWDTFEADYDLVRLINENRGQQDESLISKSETQLTAIVLGARRPKFLRTDEFDFSLPKNIEISKYKDVVDWYEDKNNRKYNVWSLEKNRIVKNQLLIDISGTPHVFGYGGVHGSLDRFSYICEDDEIILTADVSSFYPTFLIKYNSLSRNVTHKENYEYYWTLRLEYKAKKDKRQKALKIIINKTSGGMKAETSELYDPKMNNQMCVSCQLFLLDLAEHLELADLEGYKLLQSNTDAVYFKIKKSEKERAISVCKEWMERTKFDLEFTECTKIYQKDVNNYLLVTADGHIKTKGAYVKEQTVLSRDLPIVRDAIVQYMIDGTPVEETIKNCNKLIEFIMTTKASSKYLYVMYGDKKLNEKCNRVFASLREEDKGKGIYKISKATGKPNKFSNSPESCFIDNGNIINKEAPEYLDKEFYIKLAIKRLKDFGISYVRADGVVYEDEKKVNSREVVWQQKYELAKKYYDDNGNLKIKGKVVIDGINLTSWIQTQRKNYKADKLSEEKIGLLNQIGMVW